jgi:AGZA family xanthine/uracil permease-like MFS transporter
MMTATATTGSSPKLWTRGDWNALFGFGPHILVNLLTTEPHGKLEPAE